MTAEPPIEYRIDVTGEDVAARAFGSIDAAIAKNVLTQEKFDAVFSASTKRHIDLINKQAVDALVKQRLGIENVTKSATSLRGKLDEVAKATEKQAAATKQQAAATKQMASAAQLQAAATQQVAVGMGRIAPAFAAFGNQIRLITPELAQYTGALGRVGGAVAGVTNVISGGAGIAVGGALAVLGLLSTAMDDARRHSEELAKAELDRAKAHKAAGDALVQSNKNLFTLQRGPEEIQRDIDETQRRLGDIGSRKSLQGRQVGGVTLVTDPIADVTSKDLATQQNRLAALREEKKAADEKRKREREAAAREAAAAARAREARDKPFVTMRSRIAAAMESSQRRDIELAGFQAQLNAGPDAATLDSRAREKADLDVLAKKKSANDQFLEHDKETRQQEVENYKNARREMEQIDRETERRWQDLRDKGVDTFSAIGAIGIKALAALAAGQKISGKQILAAIGGELVGKGTVWLFEGIARGFSSYGLDPTATALIGTGTAAISAGIGMGAAARSGAAGAGAGGSARRLPGAHADYATPIAASRDTGARTEPREHVTVNVNSVVPPNEEQSAAIGRGISHGMRTGRIPRNAFAA